MTPPPFPGHPGRSDPGTEPLPRYGAQLAEAAATPAVTPAWQPDDTGPVPVLGRPAVGRARGTHRS
jgi:hypothetical protein